MYVRTTIDLNCDLGEGCDNDAELMKLISSANIACGYHAGNLDTMRRTVELALANGVAIGAHPGYKDQENFGRMPMSLQPGEIRDLVVDQIVSLQKVCDEFDAKLTHVKPHGALYNQAARDSELAKAIVDAIAAVDRGMIFYGLSGSVMIDEAEHIGLRTANEVFADRTYRSDGTLTPRTMDNALIHDEATAISQVMDMARYGRVRTADSVMLSIKAETVCVHGDGENAVAFTRAVRTSLNEQGIEIRSI